GVAFELGSAFAARVAVATRVPELGREGGAVSPTAVSHKSRKAPIRARLTFGWPHSRGEPSHADPHAFVASKRIATGPRISIAPAKPLLPMPAISRSPTKA